MSAQLPSKFCSPCLVSKCGPCWSIYSPSASAITHSCFHTELTGASQIPCIATAHPPFALPKCLFSAQKCFPNKPLHLPHSSQSWLPLQGSFTDIILITLHKSRANQERNNTLVAKPESEPRQWVSHCRPSGRHMLARKHRYQRMKSLSGGEGGIWLRMEN